jgi:murein DD-endopeptidase MepM/ murein hydrolase activator NlpD
VNALLFRRGRLLGWLALIMLWGAACTAPVATLPPATAPAAIPILTTLLPTVPATMTPALPTATPPPTATPFPTATTPPTALPSATLEPAIDRTCPANGPGAPEYASYVRSDIVWPEPDASVSARPALRSPLSSDEAIRFNWGFPYGSDGSGRYLLHNGLDMTQWPGAPVLAVADGTIVVAGADSDQRHGLRCNWYGQLIVLQLNDTWQGQPVYVLYGHVRGILVEPGQRVMAGEQLAEIGAGGVATVAHLHLEVRLGQNSYWATRNPLLWLEPDTETGIIAGRLLDADGHAWEGVRLTLIDVSGEAEFLTTWSYLDDPQHLISPDERWAENFVFGEVPPGEYELYTAIDGTEFRQRISVRSGEIATTEWRVEPGG